MRKTAPKCEEPFRCYIYCTRITDKKHCRDEFDVGIWKGNEHVIGEFVCDEIIEWQYDRGHQYYVEYPDDCTSYFPYLKCHSEATGLKCSEIENYGKSKTLYGWHISDLKIYDKPKELSEFYKCGAKSFEELSDTEDLCSYCSDTDFGEHKYDISSRWGMVSCEGCWCDEAYQTYLDENFALTRAPQSWQYVEEL